MDSNKIAAPPADIIKSTKKNTVSNTPSRQQQVALSKEIGARLREARTMAGYTQTDAAVKLFSYQNSSKLAKIEAGQSSQIPLWLLRKACIKYDVSADYVLGITETMERDDVAHASLRELHAFVFADFDRRHAQDIAALSVLRKQLEDIQNIISLASEQSEQLFAIRQHIEQLPEWQEVRGGNRLTNACYRLEHTLAAAKRRFNQLQKEMRIKAGVEYQLNLTLEV